MEIEARGAATGLNPMFGEWRQRFEFAPVPYRAGGGARADFRDRVRASLTNQFLYWGEVQLTATLYLDVQDVWETSNTADLDNYAKSILDALKGPDGIFIDDIQVQALAISWIDSSRTYFDVEIRSSPDDFKIKPITLFEMPDGLFYPQAETLWDVAGPKRATDLDKFAGLTIIEGMVETKRHLRHVLRQAGMTRLQAAQLGLYFETSLRGYHRSRLVESGFPIVRSRDWRAAREIWRAGDPKHAELVDNMTAEQRESRRKVAEVLAKIRSR